MQTYVEPTCWSKSSVTVHSSREYRSAEAAGMSSSKLNYYWRVFATGLSFTVFGLGGLISGGVFRVVGILPIDAEVKKRLIKAWIQKICLMYIRMMRGLGVLTYSYDLQQLEAHPGGAVIVANHPSLLDAIFVLALCKNITCIVKGALYRNPFTAVAVRLAGYIPNDSDTVMEIAAQKLADKENILIFPEGTRNTADDQLDFKRGAANLVVMANCDILPVLIGCQPRTLQKGVAWYKIPSRPPHFSLESGPALKLDECIETSKHRTLQYRQLTRFLITYYRNWMIRKRECE